MIDNLPAIKNETSDNGTEAVFESVGYPVGYQNRDFFINNHL